MKILFSVLKYRLITNESINIGVLFHNLDTDERRLETITKWSRVRNFDDEINIKFFKILISGIKEEIESTFFSDVVEFDIQSYTKVFYNEMRFTKIYESDTKDFNKFIEDTKKNFLRYDYDKKDRPTRDQQVGFMKKLMKSNKIEYSIKKPIGEYSETIGYDYIISRYAFKFFSFENKDLNKLIDTAKSWSYTANEMKQKFDTIFVYDNDIDDDKFDTIVAILGKHAYKLIKCDDTMDFILDKYNN